MSQEVLVQLLTGAIGGAVVTSIIAPLIMQRRENRKYRAELLETLVEVELRRWASDDSSYSEFRSATVRLRAQAMVVGWVDERIVSQYLRVARVARNASNDTYYDDNLNPYDSPMSGSIPSWIAKLVESATEEFIGYIVHPVTGHLRRKKIIEGMAKRFESETEQHREAESDYKQHWFND